MLEVRAPWWTRIPMIGNLGAPIIVKEVFSLVRRNRWFWAQFLYLLLLAGGMAILYASNSNFTVPPEVLGGRLVIGFFAIQMGLVFLIFPGLASTSISAERVERSFDLLVVSDLTPAELVWGKLLGVLGSAFYFLVSTLPILGVCIFFGGLSPLAIAIDYGFLFVMAITVSTWGILVSAMSRNNLLAIIGTYALALPLAVMMVALYSVGMIEEGARGIWELLDLTGPAKPVILTLSISAIVLFNLANLIGATFFLSSSESNRGTPVRIFITVLIFAGVFLCGWVLDFASSQGRFGVRDLAQGTRQLLITSGCLMFLVLVGLAGARVETPLRTVRQAALQPMRWLAVWPFLGGGVRGLVLAVLLLAVGLLGQIAIYDGLASDMQASTGSAPVYEGVGVITFLAWTAELLAAWVFAYLALAFMLSTMGLRGGINWFLTIGVSILLILLSVGMLTQEPQRHHHEMTLFSPIVTILLQIEERFPEGGSMRDAGTIGHWVAGVLMVIVGLISLRAQGLPALRLQRPGYEYLREPPPAPAAGSLRPNGNGPQSSTAPPSTAPAASEAAPTNVETDDPPDDRGDGPANEPEDGSPPRS